MKFTDNDLQNIIALCEQGNENPVAENLIKRCKRAIAYKDVSVRVSAKEKQFLESLYDENMDNSALITLKKGIISL